MVKDSLGFISFLAVFILVVPPVIFLVIFFFCAKYVIKSKKGSKYAFNNLYGVDQVANTILAGHPEETISSRLGRAQIKGYKYWWVGFLRWVVDVLSRPLDGPEHCKRAAIAEGLKMDLSREIWDWAK